MGAFRLLLLSTLVFYALLFYTTYQYYQEVELVEIPPKQSELSSGWRYPTSTYTINHKEKTYKREYKGLGLSNWLWDSDVISDNIPIQKEPIYFYRLKSDKDKKETSRYFLPSANKPITNKVILVLDIL